MVKKKTEAGQLTLSGTEEGEILARLSERVERAVAMIGELRRERDALKKRIDDAESGTSERLSQLEGERTEIRNRIETILSTLEGLEGGEE
jgi:chromosome segregation ATPase